MNISVQNLSFGYGAHLVLNNISFVAAEGTLLSVLGPNGVGKSTLFRCILGLLNGYRGTIKVGDDDINKLSSRELAHNIAYIPQSHYPTFSYSVLDMVLMGTTHTLTAFSSPGKKQAEQAFLSLERLNISHLAESDFSKLSGGEQQLVLIARALAQQAKVLLMDEPTSSLDFGNQLRVLQEIKKLTYEGYTVLLSTHNPQHALQFSDGIIALSDGNIVANGIPHEVMDEKLLRKLYDVDVRFVGALNDRIIIPSVERGIS